MIIPMKNLLYRCYFLNHGEYLFVFEPSLLDRTTWAGTDAGPAALTQPLVDLRMNHFFAFDFFLDPLNGIIRTYRNTNTTPATEIIINIRDIRLSFQRRFTQDRCSTRSSSLCLIY